MVYLKQIRSNSDKIILTFQLKNVSNNQFSDVLGLPRYVTICGDVGYNDCHTSPACGTKFLQNWCFANEI